jgi:hypothetical protein
MIKTKSISILLLLIFTFQFRSTFSQTATFSPYSRYGLGELLFNGYSWQRSMGGIGTGIALDGHLNFNNPASNATDSVTLFELGINGEVVNIANSAASKNRINGNLNYLSMGFPLKKNYWYLSLGLLPYSAAGYKIKQSTSGTEPGEAQFYYEGDGGYNRYYLGTAFKISNTLSAGINASYLYGSTDRTSRVEFVESNYLNTRITSTTTLNDVTVNGGLLYKRTLKNGRSFSAGLTFSPELKLGAKRDLLWINYYLRNGLESRRDSVLFLEKEKGNIRMPMDAGIGFALSSDNWLIGFDAHFQQWKRLQIYGIDAGLNNTVRIATGGQWTPDSKSLNYFNKVTYRIGGFYNSPDVTDLTQFLGGIYLLGDLFDKPALEVKSTNINEGGISLGFGLPLRGKPYFSDIDLTFEFSQRGTVEHNLVRERYARIILGLTLREDWFKKPQLD